MMKLDRRHRRVLDGHAAKFAVSLGRVAVAQVEKAAGRIDGKIDDRTGANVRQIHIAAIVVRLQRRDRLDLR
jgi:hypothetical protein